MHHAGIDANDTAKPTPAFASFPTQNAAPSDSARNRPQDAPTVVRLPMLTRRVPSLETANFAPRNHVTLKSFLSRGDR